LVLILAGAVVAVLGFAGTMFVGQLTTTGGARSGSTSVVVAAHDLDPRSTLRASDLTIAHWDAADVPPGTLNRTESAIGMVLQAALRQGQPVLTNQLARTADPPGQQSAFLPLPKGFVAATLPSTELVGVGGYIAVGDYIDIIAIVTPRAGGSANVRTIYSGLKVIRVGPAPASVSSGQQAGGATSSLTVAVTECQAEFLSWFLTNATLKYTLLSHEDYQAAAQAAPDQQCPTSGSVKGIADADIKARWPGLLG
jgi:Flp pilus assembly protein CpaB